MCVDMRMCAINGHCADHTMAVLHQVSDCTQDQFIDAGHVSGLRLCMLLDTVSVPTATHVNFEYMGLHMSVDVAHLEQHPVHSILDRPMVCIS